MLGYCFYVARCKDGTLYIGSSTNPEERIKRHNKGEGAAWIKQHGKARLAYVERFKTLLEARRRENQVKKWSRKKKEHLIRGLKP